MDALNYHHLRLFWVVAKEGGVSRASQQLRLAHPTVSAQIHALEEALGAPLFTRVGRRLVLTDVGRLVYRYADDIFALGRELVDAVNGKPTGRPVVLEVGICDALSKLVVRRLLEPALHLPEAVRMVCREDRHDRLLAELASHSLDVVLTDAALPPGSGVRAYHHILGECGVTFFATSELAGRHGRDFPSSLDGAPLLLPAGSALRTALDEWFDAKGVRVRVTAEFEDSSLLETFGQDGVGIFPSPSVVENAVARLHNVAVVGRTDDVRERFYAISGERRIRNAAVAAICGSARDELFNAIRRNG
jgi:LysR family transcriptional regulator, transcriptional activator of nhaA